jgi:hypothetical protein
MYIGHNQAIVINEPHVDLGRVAAYIPRSLRGGSWNTYFGGMTLREWRNYTLYLFDEWSAYVNCTWYGAEQGRVGSSDGRQMAEFTVYSLAAVVATHENRPDYNIHQMRAAAAWMCEARVMVLLNHPGAEAGRQYWRRFQTSPDAAPLRQSIKNVFGSPWTKEVLGF